VPALQLHSGLFDLCMLPLCRLTGRHLSNIALRFQSTLVSSLVSSRCNTPKNTVALRCRQEAFHRTAKDREQHDEASRIVPIPSYNRHSGAPRSHGQRLLRRERSRIGQIARRNGLRRWLAKRRRLPGRTMDRGNTGKFKVAHNGIFSGTRTCRSTKVTVTGVTTKRFMLFYSTSEYD